MSKNCLREAARTQHFGHFLTFKGHRCLQMTSKGGSLTTRIYFGAREYTLPLSSPLGLVKCQKTVSEKLPELSISVIF